MYFDNDELETILHGLEMVIDEAPRSWNVEPHKMLIRKIEQTLPEQKKFNYQKLVDDHTLIGWVLNDGTEERGYATDPQLTFYYYLPNVETVWEGLVERKGNEIKSWYTNFWVQDELPFAVQQ